MDEQSVRDHAEVVCDALESGDIGRATGEFSPELQRNLGEILALMPLPANEVTIESVEHSGAGYNVVLRMTGEIDEVQIQTRWKDRDGVPKMVEAGHLSSTARAVEEPDVETGDGTDAGA